MYYFIKIQDFSSLKYIMKKVKREAINQEKIFIIHISWASLVAQAVKNPLATQETWVRSLGWKDALEKGMATHSSVLA